MLQANPLQCIFLMKTCITAGWVFTPLESIQSGMVVIEDGQIVSISARAAAEIPSGAEDLEFHDLILAPGYIDIHVHGGAGHDVMQDDPSGRVAFERSLARNGVTSYLATTVTAPMERILGALDRLAGLITAEPEAAGARALGIHLEGPFISPRKCGVHPVDHLLDPTLERFDKLWQASSGTVKMMTIAPELPGAEPVIAEALKRGVHSSLGHSDATFASAKNAIKAGATHATHTFNAMRALDHREPGILGAVLSDDRLMADIIADGVHVAPAMIKLFLKAKGPELAVLITDAISATGMPDGSYQLGGFKVQVRGDRCEFEGKLAGSVLTMDRAVRNVMSFADWNLQQSVALASRNPSCLLGISENKGVIAEACDADLILLTPAGEVVCTWVSGRMVRD
jgi:N-acetylglucosamine-6-phosphate deacetylase